MNIKAKLSLYTYSFPDIFPLWFSGKKRTILIKPFPMLYHYLYGMLKGETLDPPKMGYISKFWYNEIL